MFDFQISKKLGNARLSKLTTPHGVIGGPFFQFVATQAVIRGMTFAEDLEKMSVQIVLANTYHLHLRPGEDIVAQAGGLHSFMGWGGPITTDSGGYQVFSLADKAKLTADSVTFCSPIDGSSHTLTPEKAIQIQAKLGADIIMPLDVCTPFKASYKEVKKAVEQTTEWAKRCKEEYGRGNKARVARQRATQPEGIPRGLAQSAGEAELTEGLGESAETGPARSQALYGIVQGGVYPDLREQSSAALRKLDFFGYCIGGELREGKEKKLAQVVKFTAQLLPEDKPRYLMGYGQPEDILEAVRSGVDQFDCVLPMRSGRHGLVYYPPGKDIEAGWQAMSGEIGRCLADPARPIESSALYQTADIAKSSWARDFSLFSAGHPVIEKPYTKAYVHHLMRAEIPSAIRLTVLHNMYYYVRLMAAIRDAIKDASA